MSARESTPPLRRVLGPTVPALVLVAVALAYESDLRGLPAILLGLLAVLGIAAGVTVRVAAPPALRDVAFAPILLALGALALETPLLPVAELLPGIAGVVFVAWLLDDPWRPPAGAMRGAAEWALPGLAVGLAWASELLLPRGAAPVGVAGGLLAGALILLVYLVYRPDLFDRDEAATI
ncbi:MAG: hypothetical protein ACRECT_04700 [Thermoplasmata archaeon]